MKNIDSLLRKIKNKTMLVVFPHPDDETVWASGLIQRANKMGYRVKVVCLTNGEKGQVHIKTNGKSLSQIRKLEMKRAVKMLGVGYEMYDFGDGRLKGGKRWKKELDKIIDRETSGIVVTYDHSGISGHPDHIVVSLEVLRLMKSKRKAVLLWVSADGKVREYLERKIKTFELLSVPSYELRLSLLEWWNKQRALRAHRSQPLGNVKWLFLWHWSEHYNLVDLTKDYNYKFVPFKI